MQAWSIHILNARGQLSDLLASLPAETLATKDLLGRYAPCLSLDIVIRASDRTMPPWLAVSGAAFGPGRIELTVDPSQSLENADFSGQLRRVLIHEYHHALRWEGPGYGRTLGEALVSEGLAQRFVHELVSCPPEPWEAAVPEDALPALARRACLAWDDAGYSHPAWFFGLSDLPMWAGYALGRAMIGAHLLNASAETALSLANAPASHFRAALSLIATDARPRLPGT